MTLTKPQYTTMKYEMTSWYKIAEEDNYKKGCGFKGANASHDGGKLFLRADTVLELLEKFTQQMGIDLTYETDNGDKYPTYELNACDEDGRVDFCITENDDGETPSDLEYKKFKADKINLWVVNYTIQIALVDRQIIELTLR